jgi:serine/threonine protein kinase
MRNTENTNEWTNWIEEAIGKEYFKCYEYRHFNNIQEIGSGAFGKVYRANWKNSEQCIALKSFFNFNIVTVKEIVHEVIKKYNSFTSILVIVIHVYTH